MQKENEYKNFVSDMIGNFTDSLSNIVGDASIDAPIAMLEIIAETINRLPRSITESDLFRKVERFKDSDITYEKIELFLSECPFTRNNTCDVDLCIEDDLNKYVSDIIKSRVIGEREKIVVLLAHMEPMIYKALDAAKDSEKDIKKNVCGIVVGNGKVESPQSFDNIYVLAITYIVYSNVNRYKVPIDKRVPFRNNILHNGVVEYSDKEIHKAYDLLVDFIEILNYCELMYTNHEDRI